MRMRRQKWKVFSSTSRIGNLSSQTTERWSQWLPLLLSRSQHSSNNPSNLTPRISSSLMIGASQSSHQLFSPLLTLLTLANRIFRLPRLLLYSLPVNLFSIFLSLRRKRSQNRLRTNMKTGVKKAKKRRFTRTRKMSKKRPRTPQIKYSRGKSSSSRRSKELAQKTDNLRERSRDFWALKRSRRIHFS